MNNLSLLNFKSIVQQKARWLITLSLLLTLGTGQMWSYTATFRCVPALTFGASWSSGNECKVKFLLGDDKDYVTCTMSGTGLMYKSGDNLYEIYSVSYESLPYNGAKDLHFERWAMGIWQENKGKYEDWCYDDSYGSDPMWKDQLYVGDDGWKSYAYEKFSISPSTTIYFDNSELQLTNPRLYIYRADYAEDNEDHNFTQIEGTPYWYKTYSSGWDNYGGLVFKNAADWNNKTANIYWSISGTSTCFTPTSNSSGTSVSTTAPVGPKNIGISNTATTYGSGNGTSGSPYLIKAGTAITCTASAEKIDASTTLEYKFNAGTTSYSTTATNTIVASAVANTNYTATATISATKSSNRSREFTTSTIYYTAKSLYTGLSVSKSPAAGSASDPTIGVNYVIQTNNVSVSAPSPATGYDFIGWTSSNGSFASASSSSTTFTPTADNAVAVANYAKHDYTITYSPSSAVNFTYTTAPSTAHYGDAVDFTITPNANYVISSVTAVDGNSNSVTVTNPSTNNYRIASMPASNVTVTVVTAPSAITVNYGAGANGSLAAKQEGSSIGLSGALVDGGSTVNFEASPNTGYEVEGWYTSYSAGVFDGKIDAAGTSETYNVDANSTLNVYVKFKLSTYSITYENMAGATNHASNPNTYTYETAAITLQTPTKTGYTFGGWFTDSDLAAEHAVSSPAILNNSTGNKTFYAKWTEDTYTVSITDGTGSSSVGIATKATVTATAAAAGKKFDHWAITGTYTLQDATTVNSREIHFTATTNVSLTAEYTDRESKTVYFAKPSDWTDGLKVYAWQGDGSDNPSNKNAAWPGVACTSTTTIKGTTYYYYTFYVDDNGEGNNLTAQNSWDKIIFNDNGNDSEKTSDLTLVGGHFYHKADGQGENGRNTATVSGSASAEDWYVCGYWDGTTNDWGFANPIALNGTTSGSVTKAVTISRTQEFKIYRASTNQWFKYTGGPSANYNDNYPALIGSSMTLREYDLNRNTFTSTTDEYRFTLDITNTTYPVLTVGPAADNDYAVTFAVSGHGSISSPGTGSTTIHRYAPTTITAVAEPGYRFTGWTVDSDHSSNVTFGDASSLSTNVTGVAGADGATITANFSNDGFVYFDASAVTGFSGGGKVYVTYLKSDALSWDGTTDALIVKNYISSDLHNREMTRIPNTNIFYFYTATAPQGKILFTSKSHDGTDYKLWEMAAVVREDFNVGQDNMFVAENYVTKDKNKTGYYDGYWMKYNETDPGVKVCIYSLGAGTPHITGSPFSFTRTEEGSRVYSTTAELLANTLYGIEIKGDNGTYYKNSGEMNSTNAVGGWDYVDRQATRGTIRTTAGGDYTIMLSCANQLILAVDFPLAVNDYQVQYSGKANVGGSDDIYASSIIRHIGDVGTKKDTVSFFVVKDDDWSLQLQRCTNVDPITWVNIGSAKTASEFSNPETGVYNFIIKQDSISGTPVTPSFATMTPEAYTGNYYIRTDASDGGWEAYKKSLDNQMIFSNYSKEHSQYDYYHCRYTGGGKNVKFGIANDYSGRLSSVMTTDAYVTNVYGNLPADANIRFMWNSETNVVSRAYLNGSSTMDFLILAAKNDSIKNTDDSSIGKVGDFNQIKFEDKNNWVYQKEVNALEGTHIRLTSNYRFSDTDHIQYFIGSDGEWTPAHTELLIGGTAVDSWQKLRLVYDFKTNHLTAAWLPPTTDITTDMSVEADMLLIRTCQDAAQQLTFNGGTVSKVKTMVGAIELRYDSIVGRVGNFNGDVIGTGGNRANRELMYYISFPFDVAVSDIYGFGQLNKQWYLQYYDGADRAARGFFRGDGTTTFWKFMTLSDTLKANVGYSLLLDNDYFNTAGKGTVWENMGSGAKIYLYFPSAKELDGDSIIASATKTITVPSHLCGHDREFTASNGRTVNHKFTDSHWNMIGVPLFQNQTDMETTKFVTTKADSLTAFVSNQGYFYEWDSIANNFSVHTTSGYTFKSMHGYMVQFTGTVEFTGSSIQAKPSPVAAHRAAMNREDYTLELQLLQNNHRVSHAYVELREEACDTFALNEDVYMMYTSQPADLFTLAGNYDVSANVLSVDNHIVPVGVEVHKAGAYTFSMTDNFSGGVTLVDNVANTRTNLAIGDYEVTLPKGVCDGRFFLEIDINKVPTSIDTIEDGGSLKDGKAHKFIENGILYILRDGQVYDARGAKIK